MLLCQKMLENSGYIVMQDMNKIGRFVVQLPWQSAVIGCKLAVVGRENSRSNQL